MQRYRNQSFPSKDTLSMYSFRLAKYRESIGDVLQDSASMTPRR
jgi:hypothetical protein